MGNHGSANTGKSQRDEGDNPMKGCFDHCSVFTGHQDIVRCIVTIDSETIASGADDGMVLVWDLAKRVAKLRIDANTTTDLDSSDSEDNLLFRPRKRAVRALLPLAELNILASCITRDPNVTLWSLTNGSRLTVLRGKHKGAVHCLASVPGHAHLLVTAGVDPLICLWTAAPTANAATLPPEGGDDQITQIIHSRGVHSAGENSPLSMAETSCMGFVERADWSPQWATSKDVSLLLALDASSIASVSGNSHKIFVYTLVTAFSQRGSKKRVQPIEGPHESGASITQMVGMLERSEFVTGDDQGKIVIWGSKTLLPHRYFSLPKLFKCKVSSSQRAREDLSIRSIAVLARHSCMAVAGGNYVAVLPFPDCVENGKRVETAEPLCRLTHPHRLAVTQIKWLPGCDGQFLVTGSEDCAIKVWDIFTREQKTHHFLQGYGSGNLGNVGSAHSDPSRSRSNSNVNPSHNNGSMSHPPTLAEIGRTNTGNVLSKKGSTTSPGGLLRSFFSKSKHKEKRDTLTANNHDRESTTSRNERHTESPHEDNYTQDFYSQIMPYTAYRPFKSIIDPVEDCICDLVVHTERVTGITTLPSTGLGFASCSSDYSVIMWAVGSYFDQQTIETVRMNRQEDLKGGEWPTWSTRTKWTMSCDPDCDWLSSVCQAELDYRINLVGLHNNPRAIPITTDRSAINRIPTALSLLGSLTDISPLYQPQPSPSSGVSMSPSDSMVASSIPAPTRVLKMGSVDRSSVPASPLHTLNTFGNTSISNSRIGGGDAISVASTAAAENTIGSLLMDSQEGSFQEQVVDMLTKWNNRSHSSSRVLGIGGSSVGTSHLAPPVGGANSVPSANSSLNNMLSVGESGPPSPGGGRVGVRLRNSPENMAAPAPALPFVPMNNLRRATSVTHIPSFDDLQQDGIPRRGYSSTHIENQNFDNVANLSPLQEMD